MITFLPYSNFAASAACLDDKRLGKQRVEALQLIRSLRSQTGWSNHPASKMWAVTPLALCIYGLAICVEWTRRGFTDTVEDKILAEAKAIAWTLPPSAATKPMPMPLWVGDVAFHRSHQSNLFRKDPIHYDRFREVGPDLPYVWPKGA